ncbi:MAG: orotate phosphoribosyltransferase, partial [Planctomycetota bacterium]
MQGPQTASSATAQTLQALRGCEALLDGHFLLSSGRHAARYIQCARLLQHPRKAEALCALLAERIRAAENGPAPVSAVVGPALGAVTLAYELARALDARAL